MILKINRSNLQQQPPCHLGSSCWRDSPAELPLEKVSGEGIVDCPNCSTSKRCIPVLTKWKMMENGYFHNGFLSKISQQVPIKLIFSMILGKANG